MPTKGYDSIPQTRARAHTLTARRYFGAMARWRPEGTVKLNWAEPNITDFIGGTQGRGYS